MKHQASKLDAHAADLRRWFAEEKLPLADARRRLLEKGVRVSVARLGTWWEAESARLQEARLFAEVANAARVSEGVSSVGAPLRIEVLIKLLERLILNLSVRGEVSAQIKLLPNLVKAALAGASVVLDERRLAIDEAKLEMLQRRAALADEAEATLRDSVLSPEEKSARIRAVFGMEAK